MAEALDTIVLSRSDAEYMVQHMIPPGAGWPVPKVLLPALRADMKNIEPCDAPVDLANCSSWQVCSSSAGASRAPASCSAAPKCLSSANDHAVANGCSQSNSEDKEARHFLDAQSLSRAGSGCIDPRVSGISRQIAPDHQSSRDSDAWRSKRCYLTCCVRLSPEKEPQR